MMAFNDILPDRYIIFANNFAALPSCKVVILYLGFVAFAPLWKKLCPPFSLKKAMLLHNIICVVLSLGSCLLISYGLVECRCLFEMKESVPVKYGLLVYLFSKYVELLDTVFMVLRHKQRQISFLHVYHHSSILLLGNYAYVFAPWPPIGAMIGLNSMVHVFLYAYYACTAVFSSVSIIWKKRLTQLQIIQFIFGLIECTVGYMYHGFCIYGIFYGLSMLILFSNFYYFAYLAKKETIKNKET